MLPKVFTLTRQPKFLSDIIAMKVNRAGTARQGVGDLFSTAALYDQLNNLGFRRGQTLKGLNQLASRTRRDVLKVRFNNIQM